MLMDGSSRYGQRFEYVVRDGGEQHIALADVSWPRPRRVTVLLALEDIGLIPRGINFGAPDVSAKIEFGSGAHVRSITVPVPWFGTAVCVAGSHVRVVGLVAPSNPGSQLASGSRVALSASVVPGRSSVTNINASFIPFALDIVRQDIPYGATNVTAISLGVASSSLWFEDPFGNATPQQSLLAVNNRFVSVPVPIPPGTKVVAIQNGSTQEPAQENVLWTVRI